jgi:hypothetical protein
MVNCRAVYYTNEKIKVFLIGTLHALLRLVDSYFYIGLRKRAGEILLRASPTNLLTLGDGANKVSVRLAGLEELNTGLSTKLLHSRSC